MKPLDMPQNPWMWWKEYYFVGPPCLQRKLVFSFDSSPKKRAARWWYIVKYLSLVLRWRFFSKCLALDNGPPSNIVSFYICLVLALNPLVVKCWELNISQLLSHLTWTISSTSDSISLSKFGFLYWFT